MTKEKNFLVVPRDNADPTSVFDPHCRESRIAELTNFIIHEILVQQDLKEWVLEHRKRFETVPDYPLNDSQIHDKFYEKARTEAERIVEEETRLVVENRANYIKNTLNIIIRQLRFLVFTDKGKGKIHIKKVAIEGNVGPNSPSERDIVYFESYPEGIEHLERIGRVLNLFASFNDYVPYMNEELTALYQQAQDLAHLETVRDWEKKDAET